MVDVGCDIDNVFLRSLCINLDISISIDHHRITSHLHNLSEEESVHTALHPLARLRNFGTLR